MLVQVLDLQCTVFTALHGMQMQSIDENSLRLSNMCIVTKWKKDLSRFLYHKGAD